jgi:hypothetical protein
MAFGQNFLKGFNAGEGVSDYAHASKTFRTNGYEFAPRSKFLFHVFFTINTAYVPLLSQAFSNQDIATIGLMVKNVQLPNYQISVESMNQYNRKRLIQTKIDYQPVQFEFHDDGGDLIRNMWYTYYSYYYKDPSQKYDNLSPNNGNLGPMIATPNAFDYNAKDTYDNSRTVNDWGFIGESYTDGKDITSVGRPGKKPFFRDIRIFGMDQHKWASYVLINPMITEWQHDTYDYSQGNGIMNHRMTLRYETVKYGTGAIGDIRPDPNVVGFADSAYYDNHPSGITNPTQNGTVLGQGGLIDAGFGIAEDLASGGVAGLIGAVQKSSAAYNTYKDKNLKSIVNNEVQSGSTAILKGSLPAAQRAVIGTAGQNGILDGIFFPTAKSTAARGPVPTTQDATTRIANEIRTAR